MEGTDTVIIIFLWINKNVSQLQIFDNLLKWKRWSNQYHTFGRGCPTPLFFEDLSLNYIPPLLQILSAPSFHLLFLLPCFFGWMCHHALSVIFLDEIVDINLPSFGTLVPAAPCSVFCSRRHQTYWRNIHGFC